MKRLSSSSLASAVLNPSHGSSTGELHSQEGKTVAAHVLREAQALADRQAACGAQAPAVVLRGPEHVGVELLGVGCAEGSLAPFGVCTSKLL